MKQSASIRATLIKRLRETGTLSASARPANAISAIEARDPVVMTVARLIDRKNSRRGARWLAPAASHSVLP